MFNKVFLAIIFTVTLSQSVDDFSSERLLGIEVGYKTVNSTNEIGLNKSSSNPEIGFRIGAQNEEWRTTVRASFMKAQGRDYQKVMLDFDRFVWASLYKTDSIVFKPYLGAHVGWLRYTDDVSLSDNGLAYGGQMGVALNVLNQVDFDLGYRYTVTDIENVDDIGSLIFSVNYLY
jgi:opacity protein-like surface antigen